MRFLSAAVLCVGLLLAVWCVGAIAGVPCNGTSTVVAVGQGVMGCDPGVAIVCPAGDKGAVVVTVTVMDCYGSPIVNRSVTCSVTSMTGVFCFCAAESSQVGTTDSNGRVTFTYNNFGGSGTLTFSADCMGVPLGPSNSQVVRGPDNDGNCVVDARDLVRFAIGFGTADARYDYNCDGIVNGIDLLAFAQHYGHLCPS